MKSEWLTASSFERAFEIVSAINTLSIHAKLKLAGIDDPVDPLEVERARPRLLEFLAALRALVENTEKDQSKIIVGADPTMGELALEYLNEKGRLPPRSMLYTLSLTQLEELVRSERNEDSKDLVECLESLRDLVENYAQADVSRIFDE